MDHTTNEATVKLCECGCGQPAPIAKKTCKRDGWIKGQPLRFIHGHFARTTRKPELPPIPQTSLAERFWSKVDKRGPDECWEWQAHKGVGGYGIIWVKNTMKKAHRISYELTNGPIPDNMFVCHNCPEGDNPACVNPVHLWLGTAADNNHDRDTKGRQKINRGADNYRAKFTDEDVRTIRQLYAQGISLSVLGRRYGVNKSAIYKVVIRESWRHIP